MLPSANVMEQRDASSVSPLTTSMGDSEDGQTPTDTNTQVVFTFPDFKSVLYPAELTLFLSMARKIKLPVWYSISLLPEALSSVIVISRGGKADAFRGQLVSAVGSSGWEFAQAGGAAH